MSDLSDAHIQAITEICYSVCTSKNMLRQLNIYLSQAQLMQKI